MPPPVPIAELAAAHGLATAEVESFVADLHPLLERTPHGLMFRDEPTETLIRSMAQGDQSSRDQIVQQLLERQSQSDYAARALPAVLTALQNTEKLVALAFNQQLPPGASSVSQRDIRLARIVAALEICARAGRHDDLMGLLLEASLVAAGHERSDRFLYEHPDLVAVAGDNEALRRLFMTKTGWPGGKHSALALANAFTNDFDEARRNAWRAIDWHNWNVSQQHQTTFNPVVASTEWDVIGFAYVEMLAGADTRIARWFARLPEGTAYAKFADLFDLLERHPNKAGTSFLVKDRLLDRIARCRLPARAFWAAALCYSLRDAGRDRRLIGRLSASPVPETKDDLPLIALLSGAARAISLGMRREARLILKGISVKRPSIHKFSSSLPFDDAAECAVIAAGLKATLRGTAPTLLDIAPRELLDLIPQSMLARGPKAFASELDKWLGDSVTNQTARRKRQKTNLSYEELVEYKRAVDHRITPLIGYAELVSRIASPRVGETIPIVMSEALDRLERDVASASTYPYRDGKAYITRIGFSVLFDVIDAIGGLDRPTAQRMIAWLKHAPGLFTPSLTQVVSRLSRSAALHNAALELADHVKTLILTDTDTESRIAAYGELARAVWRVSHQEAAAYFRCSLDLAEAIGSDDFDRTNHLLALAGQYGGDPLKPEAAHDLARIFDLNQQDASRFPWSEYAQAMAPVAGIASLAIVARLDDRAKADLELSLPPLLTALVSNCKLPPDLASCLIGLARPLENWSWQFSTFVKAALKQLATEQREWLFDLILIEIDRTDLHVPGESIQDLLSLAKEHLPTRSAALKRLQAVANRHGLIEPPMRTQGQSENVPAYDDVEMNDPDALDRAIESAAIDHAWHGMEKLARRAATPAARLYFVEAVARVNAPKLSDKIRALKDHLEDWTKHSQVLRDRLPQIAVTLVAKHAPELVGQSWDTDDTWRHLTSKFKADRSSLVAQVIASLAVTAKEVSGDSWLALATQLAPAVGSESFRTGLERFLTCAGATLPAEVGDGPWDDRFVVTDNPVEAVAGLIWSRLGNYRAASRWRAAHAVRRLAAVYRFDVIDRLVARFNSESALPFCDSKLPFYTLHARLWLLVALARIGKDHPLEVAKYRPLLEKVAFDTSFPHIAMRAFAADALRQILSVLPPADADALGVKLSGVNHSPFPCKANECAPTGVYSKRPELVAEPENEFSLDYDFSKYQASDLVRIFACADWEITDGITRWVRKWDSDIRAMYQCPRIKDSNYNFGSWTSGSPPDVDRYGGYLGWHAFMLVAGEMLKERPLMRQDWDEYLRGTRLSRPDGLWLSDATDSAPLDLVTSLPMPEVDTEDMDPEDQRVLAQLLGIDDGKILRDTLVVSGYWTLPGNVTVTVSSVLAKRADARATVLAALTGPKFFRWLPDDEDNIEREFRGADHSVTAWLSSNDYADSRFDRHDPYATPTALSRPSPEQWVLEKGAISSADPIVRSWSNSEGPVFYVEAWGTTGERRKEGRDESGNRITVNAAFLRSVLKTERKLLVGLVKAQLYISDESKRASGDMSAFTHRVMLFTLDEHGRVRIASRISKKARAAVDELTPMDRTNFGARFLAIRNAHRRKTN